MRWKQRFSRILSPSETEDKVPPSPLLSVQVERKARDKSTNGEPGHDGLSKSNIQRVLNLPRQLRKSH
jgi:hypothetical protein